MPATPGPWIYSRDTEEILAGDELIAAQVKLQNVPLILAAARMLAVLKVIAQQARLSPEQRKHVTLIIIEAEAEPQ